MTGTLAEYLVATSIMAISLTIAWHFAVPIVLVTTAGALLTWLILRRLTRMVFSRYRFERFIGMFAQMTGTISSGLALLRVSDPGFRTPVAQELVLSSGMALAFGFPLLILINLPFTAFGGAFRGFLIVWGLMAAYLVTLAAAWALYRAQEELSTIGRDSGVRNDSTWWRYASHRSRCSYLPLGAGQSPSSVSAIFWISLRPVSTPMGLAILPEIL